MSPDHLNLPEYIYHNIFLLKSAMYLFECLKVRPRDNENDRNSLLPPIFCIRSTNGLLLSLKTYRKLRRGPVGGEHADGEGG